MPDRRRARCRNCNHHRDEVGPISWRGLCQGCAVLRSSEGIAQMRSHAGPVFQHWRRQLVASGGGVILDAPAVHGQTRSDA